MEGSTKKFLHVFTAAVIFATGFFIAPQVFAAGNCCLYFVAEPSATCNAYTSLGNPNGTKITGFSCSKIIKDSGKTDYYFNFTKEEAEKNSALDLFIDQYVNKSPNLIAHPNNFVGGYVVDTPGKKCISGALFGAVLKESTDDGEYGLCGGDGTALKSINKNLDTPVNVGKLFDSHKQKFCCVPKPESYSGSGLPSPAAGCKVPEKWTNIGSSGGIPSLLPSLSDLFYNFDNKFPVQNNGDIAVGAILSCGEVGSSNYLLSPLSCASTIPLSTEISQYLVGGAANLKNYSLANYCAIKEQVPYYCACKTDRTACFPTKYSNKAECLAGAPSSSYECLGLAKGKTQCNDILVIEQKTDKKPVDNGVPFSVPDISDLNKLGTTDISVVIGRIVKGALGIIGTIAFALFVYAGLLWMVSGGNSDRMGKAKDILVWTSLGIAVIFASYAIVDIIFEVFR